MSFCYHTDITGYLSSSGIRLLCLSGNLGSERWNALKETVLLPVRIWCSQWLHILSAFLGISSSWVWGLVLQCLLQLSVSWQAQASSGIQDRVWVKAATCRNHEKILLMPGIKLSQGCRGSLRQGYAIYFIGSTTFIKSLIVSVLWLIFSMGSHLWPTNRKVLETLEEYLWCS